MRSFAWLLAAAVALVTLGPPGLRPHSDLGQDGEHALAFILIGLVFGLAYPRRRLATTAIAVVMIAALELLQLWAPGRHARMEDFVVDAGTVCLGFALATIADWLTTRLRASSPVTGEGPAE